MITPNTKLKDVRSWIKSEATHGVQCPACDNYVKVYKRPLTPYILNTLQAMAEHQRTTGNAWMTPRELSAGHREQGKLALWGLAWSQVICGETTWALTDLGWDFLETDITVPAFAFVFQGQLIGLRGPQVSFNQKMGIKTISLE